MTIEYQLNQVRSTLPAGVQLVAVSKTKSNEEIMEAYNAGQRIFGENKVQELVKKWETLPKDIEWHFIGHLQSNKVKYIAPFISMIHSADSFKLLKTINEEGRKSGRRIPCLLQFHIADEESKFGFLPNEVKEMNSNYNLKELHNIIYSGVMGMATYTSDESRIRNEFSLLYQLFRELKGNIFSHEDQFCEVSMGMSSDYLLAIEEGSTLVRIGSTIFGDRCYVGISG